MFWYCIHTKPKKESQVAAYCRDLLGLNAYYPQLRERRTIRRVRRVVVGPLFPRYLFCRFDPTESYRRVRYAPDVIDIVQFGARPAVVAESLIADLQHWVGDALDSNSLPQLLKTGDTVQINGGPLQGVTGVIMRATDDSDRVELLLSLLQEGAKVTVPRDQLELACAV
jgi:transcriptional antiterminator RfaH